MSTCLAGALVTCERTLGTHECSCVPRVAKYFFILVAHSPLRVMGHVSAPEPSHQGGRVQSREAHDSVEALPCGEAGSGAEGYVTVPEPTLARRRGLEPLDTWQRQSSPQLGGKV
jgi:hypothetical protein